MSSEHGEPGAAGDPRSDGRSTRWETHRARRREQVVDAALVVLGRDGQDFGLDQVAHEAGVTKPVIYRHFGDRAALLDAMAARATDRLMERLMPVLYRENAARTRIHDSVDAVLGFLEDSPGVDLLFRRRLPGQRGEVVDAGREFIASALAGVLGSSAAALGIEESELVGVWSRSLVGSVQATAEWWLRGRETGTAPAREVVAEHLTVLIWAQIAGLARRRGVTLSGESPLPVDTVPK
ncbi:TetR/AcrR family transcriptional regulator [Pseudonocardia sp. HH130629-09]|uniref:TetR/AcrR family transcriptional regulator n=1 Tax=Pseudonocardia sp. HH130629-09 TaxID=1641402 RepID=UPI000A92BF0F|nr:TetR/AcrR family transcriptional regulator [Pseudonocardia sp. HH130629-09]